MAIRPFHPRPISSVSDAGPGRQRYHSPSSASISLARALGVLFKDEMLEFTRYTLLFSANRRRRPF